MKCESCQTSDRMASVTGKCSDCFSARHISPNGWEHDGYVPRDLGIGGGDYIEFKYCLNCGKIVGEFPLPTSALEMGEEEE